MRARFGIRIEQQLDPMLRRVPRPRCSGYDRLPMVLAAFLFGLALSIAALTVAVVRGVRLWRQMKRTTRTFTSQLASFEEKTARTDRHLAEWEGSSRELEAALARLRGSRARLRVLQDALEQAQARVRWLRVFVPR